jgi:hypothetical protein
MTQNILTAGDASISGISTQGGNDGTFVVVVGPNGGKINAISVAASGNTTLTGNTSLGGTATLAGNLIFADGSIQQSILRSHLAGLTMSTAGSSATMGIAAGQAADSTNAVLMNLVSAYTKTTSGWVLGTAAGGLDTGVIANNTWYHFYLIRRADTGIVDIIFSTNATTPTLPTNYTQYRRIGSGRTSGSAQWIKFVQNGDEFLWDAVVNNVSGFTGTTTIQSVTMTVPLGVKVNALLSGSGIAGTGGDGRLWVFSPDVNSSNVLSNSGNFNFGAYGANIQAWSELNVRTNLLSQVYFALYDATGALFLTTKGWLDRRGRDA